MKRFAWGCQANFSLSCIGEGNGNPLQCSCLDNPRDRGAWWAAVYGVAQSRTRLKWLSSSSQANWWQSCACLLWISRLPGSSLLPALPSRIPNIFPYQFLPTPTLRGPFCDAGAHSLPAGQLGAKAFTLYCKIAYSVNLGFSSFIFLSGELKRRFFFLFASTVRPLHSILSFDKKAK